MGMKCISENQRTILDVLLMNGVFFNAVNLPAPLHFLFYSFWRIFFQGRPNSGVSCSNAEALFYSPIYQWSRKPKCAWTQNQIKILITLVLQLNIQCWPMFIFHLSRLLPLMSIFFELHKYHFCVVFRICLVRRFDFTGQPAQRACLSFFRSLYGKTFADLIREFIWFRICQLVGV